MRAVRVKLHGGPNHLPAELRVHEVADLTERVKVPFGGGYEHFEYSGELGEDALPRYVWRYRTRIAE